MSAAKLSIREEFREQVFGRDNHKCIVCGAPAVDAHHIIERALWIDPSELGGYLKDNGASLCEKHHLAAEKNWIAPQALRNFASIKVRILPKQLDPSKIYNKWGEVVRSPSRNVNERIKYPHTCYLSFSPSVDQKDIDDAGYIQSESLAGKPLVLTIKLDGSNALLVREGVAARNASVATHKSFDMLKSIHQPIAHLIPNNIQIFGEWLYAKHSIHYTGDLALSSLYRVFAVYNRDQQLWYGWKGVEAWAKALGFETVPVLTRIEEPNTQKLTAQLCKIGKELVMQGHEGFVVRSEYPFYYGQFSENLGKYVRANHVATDEHWSTQAIVKNELKA